MSSYFSTSLKFGLFFISCSLSVSSAYSQTRVKLGVSEFPPYVIFEGNKVSGIDIMLVNILMSKLSLKIEYVRCPWKRCLDLMKQGKIDMLTGVFRRPDREQYLQYITPHYVQAENAFYIPKGSRLKIEEYSDLHHLRIGLERGSQMFEPFDSDQQLTKFEVSKMIQAIRMTKLGRLDTFIGATIPTEYLLLQANLHTEFRRAKFVYIDKGAQGYFVISKKSEFAKDLENFNKVLYEMKNKGTIEEIFKLFSQGGVVPEFSMN